MAVNKATYIDFRAGPPSGATAKVAGTTTTEATGTDNTTDIFTAPGGVAIEIRHEQTNADILPVAVVDSNCTNGWQIPNDNADNDGIEMSLGILSDENAKYAFKIGTDPAFKMLVKFGIPDVSDYDVCFVGFRKAGAYVDAINTPAAMEAAYDDKAGFDVEAGAIHILTSLNGSDTDTDTTDTWVDDAVKTLGVFVSAAGVVTYTINGSAPTTSAAFTFDSGDIVVPCLVFTKGAAVADTPPILTTLYVGPQ